jgi:aminopeptidase-like protein
VDLALFDTPEIGDQIFALAAELYPICRSITGSGVRETLRLLSNHIDLQCHRVPSGTTAFDWQVPLEWNIRNAHIHGPDGNRILDFRDSNLHVVSYSEPIDGRFRLEELKQHIFTLPDQPDLIPYRTSYYQKRWGFCMEHRRLKALPDGVYDVLIDSSLADGYMDYGEYYIPGETQDEVLFSAHICHPSLANDNCSGLALLTHLAQRLTRMPTRYSYRFVFIPGTIGAIVWLSRNEHLVSRIAHGLVVSCVGDKGGPNYKKSRRGNAAIDRAMTHVLGHLAPAARISEFSPYGYDERQYCSPGFNLPVGLFQRSQFATFPEYHTSGDNLELIRPEHLATSYQIIANVIGVLENDRVTRNLSPKCEPQLGKRGLYATMGGDSRDAAKAMALLWVLNLSDGTSSLLDMAERAGIPFPVIDAASRQLQASGLIQDMDREI